MSVLEYCVLSLALTVPVLATVCEGARRSPVRLTRGLVVSFVIALEHVLFLLLGLYVGNLFSTPDAKDYNGMVYLGIMILVGVWMLFPLFRRKGVEAPVYEIARWTPSVLLGVATGMKTFLVGLALGFIVLFKAELWKIAVPLVVLMFVGGYLGIMFGRREKSFHVRRWQLIAVLFLLVFALKGAFWGE